MATSREIWDTLSKINVNDHTDKKNNFTYLSWTWAWATLQENYPDSTYEFRQDMWHGDTCEVWVDLTVEGITRSMWLAVTDFRNKPVSRPTCDLIANARMRCLVKAIAMFGLGHYIYAGESLPMEASAPELPKPSSDMVNKFKAVNSMDELRSLWEGMTKEDRAICSEIKNQAKARIEKGAQ